MLPKGTAAELDPGQGLGAARASVSLSLSHTRDCEVNTRFRFCASKPLFQSCLVDIYKYRTNTNHFFLK